MNRKGNYVISRKGVHQHTKIEVPPRTAVDQVAILPNTPLSLPRVQAVMIRAPALTL